MAAAKQGFAPGTTVRTEQVYDLRGRLVASSRPHLTGDQSQGVVTVGYDSMGRSIWSQTADGVLSETFYATRGTLRQDLQGFIFANPEAKRAVISRNPRGDALLNPDQHLSHQVFDERGAVLSTGENYDTTTEFTYGPGGFLLATRDPVGNISSNVPDAFGRLGRAINPSNGAHEYSYNAWDQILGDTHNTEQHDFSYDQLGRLTGLSNSDGFTGWIWDEGDDPESNDPNVTVTHFGALMEQFTSAGHGEVFAYDEPGGAVSAISRYVQTPSGRVDMSMAYQYDAFGRPEIITYPQDGGNAFAVRNVYSNSGFLQRVENAANTNQVFWNLDEAYQGFVPARVTFGDGTNTQYVRHALSGLLQEQVVRRTATNEQLLRTAFTYDANRNVESIRRYHDPSETVARWFEYDRLDRLTRVTSGSGAGAVELRSIGYGRSGNILSKSDVGAYIYGVAGEQDTAPQTLPYAVRSTAGPDGVHTYEYDPDFGDMTARSGPTVPGGAQEFEYTATRLVRRVQSIAGTADFEYGAGGDRVLRVESSGEERVHFGSFYESREPLAEFGRTDTLRVLVNGRAVAEVMREGGTITGTTYLHRDHLGSPEITTNALGVVIGNHSYGVFGESQSAESTTAIGYTGHREEIDIGLTDMQARFYDTRIGRFISPDPTIPAPAFTQAHNRFSYVYNNPMSLVDPTGLGPAGGDDERGGGKEIDCGGPLCLIAVVAVGGAVFTAFVIAKIGGAGGNGDWKTWWKTRDYEKLYPWNWFDGPAEGNTSKPVVPGDRRASAVNQGSASATPLIAIGETPQPNTLVLDANGNRIGQVSADGRVCYADPTTCRIADTAESAADAIDAVGEGVGIVMDVAGVDGVPGPGPLTAAMIIRKGALEGVERSFIKGAARGVGQGVRRAFTSDNFRSNLAKLSGANPATSHAHHVLPQKFGRVFERLGINIHDPKFGAWWDKTSHLQNASRYNAEWQQFLRGGQRTADEVLQFGRELSGRYGVEIFF